MNGMHSLGISMHFYVFTNEIPSLGMNKDIVFLLLNVGKHTGQHFEERMEWSTYIGRINKGRTRTRMNIGSGSILFYFKYYLYYNNNIIAYEHSFVDGMDKYSSIQCSCLAIVK